MNIDLILIDDHKMILEGLIALFSQRKDIRILAKLSNFAEVREFALQYTPPSVAEVMSGKKKVIAICDLSFGSLPSEDTGGNAGGREAGFEIIKFLNAANKDIQCIVYSMHSSASYVNTALSKEIGGTGYVLKDSDAQTILDAVDTVAAGKIYLQKEVSQTIYNASTITQFFTKKEQLVAEQLSQHLSNEEIAERLGLAKRTVANYISNLYTKTGTDSRQELIRLLNGNLE